MGELGLDLPEEEIAAWVSRINAGAIAKRSFVTDEEFRRMVEEG